MKTIGFIALSAGFGLLLLNAQSAGEGGGNLIKLQWKNEVAIRTDGEKRIIESNGIPEHEVGRFPGRGNPNSIAPQRYHFEVPLHPKIADKVTLMQMQPFGIAVNGLVFDPGTAEFWHNDRSSGWHYEAGTGKLDLGLDANMAHVQPSGAYHYHAIPLGLVKQLNPENKPKMTLVGWAADGFPIYARWGHADPKNPNSEVRALHASYKVKQGTRPGGPGGNFDGTFTEDFEYLAGSGDLDECGGRFGATPENPEGIYHYVLTDDYPFIPRLFKGTPDPSFQRRGPPPGGGPGGGPGGRRGPPRGFPPPGSPPPPPR
jgi:hypothetical protein